MELGAQVQRILHSSFESHAESISDVDLEARMLRLYEPYWLMRRVHDGPVSVQHAVEGSGFLTQGAISPAGWGLLMQSAGEPMLVNGKPLTKDAVAVLPPGAEFRFVGRGPTIWTSVFVPSVSCLESNPMTTSHKSVTAISVTKGLTHNLVRHIDNQLTIAERGFDTGGQFGERVLADALDILSVAEGVPSNEKTQSRERTDELAHAINAVRGSREGLSSVQELAAAADVSDRTLLTVFRQHLGVSPQEYLSNDRLHRARRVLQSNEPGKTTVAAVAAQFGYLDFGRFAAKYRRLFGEFPSVTLRSW